MGHLGEDSFRVTHESPMSTSQPLSPGAAAAEATDQQLRGTWPAGSQQINTLNDSLTVHCN